MQRKAFRRKPRRIVSDCHPGRSKRVSGLYEENPVVSIPMAGVPGAAYRILAAAGAALAPAWASSSELSREDIQWLDRVTYGASTATVDEYLKLGRRRFLNEQLHPKDVRLPRACRRPDRRAGYIPLQRRRPARCRLQRAAAHQRAAGRDAKADRPQGTQRPRQQARLRGGTQRDPPRAVFARPTAGAVDVVLAQSFQRVSIQGQ